MKDCIFEFACDRERPEVAALSAQGVERGLRIARTFDRERRSGVVAIEVDREVRVRNLSVSDVPLQRPERDPFCIARPIGASRQLACLALRSLDELRAWHHLIDQTPFDGALAANALLSGAEEISAIAEHVPLIDQPRKA